MSQMGHSRRFLDMQLTSASPSIADIGVRRSERREGPGTDPARSRKMSILRAIRGPPNEIPRGIAAGRRHEHTVVRRRSILA